MNAYKKHHQIFQSNNSYISATRATPVQYQERSTLKITKFGWLGSNINLETLILHLVYPLELF